MQQRIALEAKSDSESMRTIADAARRDSLEMKGIAYLTMIFLPMTALAVSLPKHEKSRELMLRSLYLACRVSSQTMLTGRSSIYHLNSGYFGP
jgi:hypothetical protein